MAIEIEKEELWIQQNILKQFYPDYNPQKHKSFIERYHKDVEKERTHRQVSIVSKMDPRRLLSVNINEFKKEIQKCGIDAIPLAKAAGRELQEAFDKNLISDTEYTKTNMDIIQLIQEYREKCTCSRKPVPSKSYLLI